MASLRSKKIEYPSIVIRYSLLSGAREMTLQNMYCISGGLTDQGPVVQSIVSLTSSLRGQLVKCFTTL